MEKKTSGTNGLDVAEENENNLSKQQSNPSKKQKQKTTKCDEKQVKRKLHKAYIKAWKDGLEKNGFARCLIRSCNFISSDITAMQNHHRTCNGLPHNPNNFCEKCQTYLLSCEETLSHKATCQGIKNTTQQHLPTSQNEPSLTNISIMCEKWENEIKLKGEAICGNEQCNFIGKNISDLKNHYESCIGAAEINDFCCPNCKCIFSTKRKLTAHEKNCLNKIEKKKGRQKAGEKDKNIHFKEIQKMKPSGKNSIEDHIIQPRPNLPRGEYMRRRPYTNQHKNSWISTLEKYKYVKCIFQNCYFIAMSLEDMISHFGYCNGDGSFAQFNCSHCNGRVTSEDVLKIHIQRSHSDKITKDNVEESKEIALDKTNLQSESEPRCGVSKKDVNDKEKSESARLVETKQGSNNNQTTSKAKTLYRMRMWKYQLEELGYALCGNSKCNLISFNTSDLHVHIETCNGEPDYELLCCRKCKKRLPREEDLSKHETDCNVSSETILSDVHIKEEVDTSIVEVILEEDGPKIRKRAKLPRTYSKKKKNDSANQEPDSVVSHPDEGNCSNDEEKVGKRRRKSKVQHEEKNKPEKAPEQVRCGKCDFTGTKKSFDSHNLKKHTGLGWMEGEEPVDTSDEKEVIRRVREAFKLTKKGTCEICQDVKKSFMGFVSHIQSCGKSDEEKNALKVKCPHCPKKYMSYSLPSHIKLSHSTSQTEEVTEDPEPEAPLDPSGKRKSAVRAVDRFRKSFGESLEEDEKDEERDIESSYFTFKKGVDKLPKLCPKLINVWYKLKKENRPIPCRHKNCPLKSEEVQGARQHHYTCSQLPEESLMCVICDFYTVDLSEIRSHVLTHRKVVKQKKLAAEEKKLENEMDDTEEDEEDDEEMGEIDEEEEGKPMTDAEDDEEDTPKKTKKRKRKANDSVDDLKQKKSKNDVKIDLDDDVSYRQNFCRKKNLENIRGVHFYSRGLDMTFEEEVLDLRNEECWPQLHTDVKSWSFVSSPETESVLPRLSKSISFSVRNEGKKELKWRTINQFEGDLIEGVPVMFAGGSIRSMSWCKISFKRMMEKNVKQYLALSTSKGFDYLTNIQEQSEVFEPNLLQIWNIGELENAPAKDKPKFSLGIVVPGGEIWDLAWLPEDSASEGVDEWLARIGLLATASEDGFVRVWSICEPSQLPTVQGLPIYKTEPVVKLLPDEESRDCCYRLATGRKGIIAGGYTNGMVFVWSLNNVSSPFCRSEGKSRLIKAHLAIQAHRTSITALTFCPSDSRYLSTGSLDRTIKMWDLKFPMAPAEQVSKELCLDNVWVKNWPVLFYNFDDIINNCNKGHFKFVRGIVTDKHQSSLVLENTCLSMSFNDWLSAVCGCNNTGEVKVRLLKNFISDQKFLERNQTTISYVTLQKLKDEPSSNIPGATESSQKGAKDEGAPEGAGDKEARASKAPRNRPATYEEIDASYGLIFNDNMSRDKVKPKKSTYHPEDFPVEAANKISFNPNFKSFTHVAVGYNCGLIRVQAFKEMQTNKTVNSFIDKVCN